MPSELLPDIQHKIHTIRGKQVMLDRDLAQLYGVEPRRLREQVKRNSERFPEDFMFQINLQEYKSMVSHFATPSKQQLGGHLPYVFTEQGVATLSGVLKSKKAIEINIKIIRAFVAMRHFLLENEHVFQRLNTIEYKQITYDKKFDILFNALEQKQLTPKQGIFYDGQIYDAHVFVVDLIKQAKKKIVLIDPYIDTSVLTLMSHKANEVKVTIYTATVSEKLTLAQQKFNKQYDNLSIQEFTKSHDRFLIIDSVVYHIGASLKDVGKKWFAFSRIDIPVLDTFQIL